MYPFGNPGQSIGWMEAEDSMTELRKPPVSEKPVFGPGADPLMDCHAAAAYLGVHPRTLQRMVLRGEIQAVRVGKLYRFVPSAIQHWVLQQNLAS
jgi:excisionase family DNA binding protein